MTRRSLDSDGRSGRLTRRVGQQVDQLELTPRQLDARAAHERLELGCAGSATCGMIEARPEPG
jgi:hypothetical protein